MYRGITSTVIDSLRKYAYAYLKSNNTEHPDRLDSKYVCAYFTVFEHLCYESCRNHLD